MAHYDYILNHGTALIYNENTKVMESHQVSLALKDGKIASLQIEPSDTAEQTLDLKGLHILPGVIDSQVHFREPGMTHKEDLESGTRAALLGGVTTIFEMPNTFPSTTTEESFLDKLLRAEKRAHCNYAFFIGGSPDNTLQLSHLEKMAHCSGVKVFLGSSFGNLLVDEDSVFEQILQNGSRRVIIHSEDEKRLKDRKQIAIDSGHPRSHPIWRDEESAFISTHKSVRLARKYNRPVHILHVSSGEEMDFLAQHKDIATVEILPQYLTFSAPDCYERFGTLAQQNPPIRDIRHFEYLWKAVNNGCVDVIGSDHAPHTLEEKSQTYPQSPSGIPGVQTLLPVMLNHVHEKRLSLEKLTMLLTENPRRVFGLQNKGRIAVGFDADLTLVDLNKKMEIKKSWLASKSNWSIFEGMQVTGWPVGSFINGQLALKDDEILLPHSGKPVLFN
ncbi:MAG: dihydroorotase [Moraxellaceae bacterium]|nr:dihydroorotase [Pseudobdellovibrionaceae bacterium]